MDTQWKHQGYSLLDRSFKFSTAYVGVKKKSSSTVIDFVRNLIFFSALWSQRIKWKEKSDRNCRAGALHSTWSCPKFIYQIQTTLQYRNERYFKIAVLTEKHQIYQTGCYHSWNLLVPPDSVRIEYTSSTSLTDRGLKRDLHLLHFDQRAVSLVVITISLLMLLVIDRVV